MTMVGVLGETAEGERRVALTPDGVQRLRRLGVAVTVEAGAGRRAWFGDEEYVAAGATTASRTQVYATSDVLVCIDAPDDAGTAHDGQVLIGLLGPLADPDRALRLARAGVTAISLDLLPRTLSRAQAMDALSSQANVAGYKAAILAAEAYGGYFPMLMTAAGTTRPAQVLVLGAGGAGLQAIATARRLGALVTGYDVREAARAEIASTGAAVLDLPHPTPVTDGLPGTSTSQRPDASTGDHPDVAPNQPTSPATADPPNPASGSPTGPAIADPSNPTTQTPTGSTTGEPPDPTDGRMTGPTTGDLAGRTWGQLDGPAAGDVAVAAAGRPDDRAAGRLEGSAVGASNGYARELTAGEAGAQQSALAAVLPRFDVVITTAQVPGRRPPLLVPAGALAGMRPGSVVVDLAAGPLGGNVAGSVPETRTVTAEGVTLLGAGRLPSTVPRAASTAYARNLVALLAALVPDGAVALDLGDEIQRAVLVTHGGRVVHERVRELIDDRKEIHS